MSGFAGFLCFCVLPLPRARRTLRRYQALSQGTECGPRRRHEANVVLDEVDYPLTDTARLLERSVSPLRSHPAWPSRCEDERCPVPGGYTFADGDLAYVVLARLGEREDTRELVEVYSPPHGGLLDAASFVDGRGADGRSLAVMTPQGWWYIDTVHRATGRRWTRVGDGAALTTTQVGGPWFPWKIVEGRLMIAHPKEASG